MAARSEGPANVGTDHLDALARQTERRRQQRLIAQRPLSAADQCHDVGLRVVPCRCGARLHVGRGDALVAELVLDHGMRARKGRRGRGLVAGAGLETRVARRLRPELDGLLVQRVGRMNECGKRVILDFDELEGVARLPRRFRDDQRHGLAEMKDAFVRENLLRDV